MWLNTNDNTVIKKAVAIIINGVTHPKTIFSKWSELELNDIGIYTPIEDTVPNERYYTYNEVIDFTNKTITRTPIEKPLADLQALMIKDLEDTANSKFNEATAGYTAGEMASWNELELEAIAHQTTPLTEGMLYDEAMLSGISVDELATKVLLNAGQFKALKAYIAGTRKFKDTEIGNLLSVDECILYERTPYDYTITAEDVANDIDGTLVEGTIVVRYMNRVKDW